MSKREKALNKIRNNPKNVRYEELEAVLIFLGFEKRNTGSSHVVFTRAGSLPLTIPIHKPQLKPFCVKLALRTIDEIDCVDDD